MACELAGVGVGYLGGDFVKPCPYCRAKGESIVADTDGGSHWVLCFLCGSRGPLATTEAKAWELWGLAERGGV